MTDSEIIENNSENIQKEYDKSRLRMILLLFFLIVGFSMLSVIADSWMDNRAIKKVKVYGCSMSSKGDIAALVRDSVIHKRIMDVNTAEIIKRIKTNSFVSDARVNALFNGEFQVFVTERNPIGITVDNDGEIKYCDNTGYIFPYNQDGKHDDLPVIRGLQDTEEFVATAKLLSRILNESIEYSDIISEIKPGRGKNTFEIISSDYGYRLLLDDKSSLSEQLSKYFSFISSSLCGNDLVKIDYIDLRWEKRIVIGKSI